MRLHTALGLSFAVIAATRADATTTATISIDGGLPVAIPLVDAGFGVYSYTACLGNACTDQTGTGWRVQVDAEFDPNLLEGSDPYITWGVSVYNSNGADLPISIVLETDDIQLRPTPGVVRTSVTGATTNANNLPGVVTVTPLAAPGGIPLDIDGNTEIQVFNVSNDGGTTKANAGIDLGPAFNSNGGQASDTYPAQNSGVVAGPINSGNYDYMRLDINFSVSDGGDTFTGAGTAAIPEPETAALIALGLLGLGYVGRRRNA